MIYISFSPLGPWRSFAWIVIFLVKLIVGWMCRWTRKLVCTTCTSHWHGPYSYIPPRFYQLTCGTLTAERLGRWTLEKILRSSQIKLVNEPTLTWCGLWIPSSLSRVSRFKLCFVWLYHIVSWTFRRPMEAAFYSVFRFTKMPVVVVHMVSLDVLASNLSSIWCPLSSSLWIVCQAWMEVTVRQERQAEDVKMKCITRDQERRK